MASGYEVKRPAHMRCELTLAQGAAGNTSLAYPHTMYLGEGTLQSKVGLPGIPHRTPSPLWLPGRGRTVSQAVKQPWELEQFPSPKVSPPHRQEAAYCQGAQALQGHSGRARLLGAPSAPCPLEGPWVLQEAL